jgi:hypothetical protein
MRYEALWSESAHADGESESFTHWDEEIPPEVPESCAKCHSTPGYLDFLGLDETEAGVVDSPAPIGTVIRCVACHNEATEALDSVVFPSGETIAGVGSEARCIECHQGRASTAAVEQAIAELGLPDDDTASEELGFVNIHYQAAAAAQFGGVVQAGYQYPGKTYDAQSSHVEGLDTCTSCHDAHSLGVDLDRCAECHADAEDMEDLRDTRLEGSRQDYDGDGDADEGIYYEIEGLRETLYGAIQAYARTSIVYDESVYPYFFLDTDIDGEADEEEAAYPNKYNAWTPRLLRAAYNYQLASKDAGAYIHGGKYVIQLLYDSIEDLDAELVVGLQRIDSGHFAGSQEAFRHWDEDGSVSAGCALCHSATGLPTFHQEGVNVSAPLSNGFLCSTCHFELPDPSEEVASSTHYTFTGVTFPSGAVLDAGDTASNLCMVCHQGRNSTDDVDEILGGLLYDRVYPELQFRQVNIHYSAAGATLLGGEARGAYQYLRRTYVGRFVREEILEEGIGCNTCTQCHDSHGPEINFEACLRCHEGIENPRDVRGDTPDYDVDGDTTEGVAGEIETLHEILYESIQSYARVTSRTPIVYDAHAYPYFFVDTDADGQVDPGENTSSNQYNAWTPRMLRAAYNYQFVAKDPGAYAHNSRYVLQILYDSLSDLGRLRRGMRRP